MHWKDVFTYKLYLIPKDAFTILIRVVFHFYFWSYLFKSLLLLTLETQFESLCYPNVKQETLYPREKSSLKPTDRCVVLRLVHCECTESLCLERRVLEVQAHLKRINLRMMAESVAVE